SRHELKSFFLRFHSFGQDNGSQTLNNLRKADSRKIEALAARQDRGRYLLHFGRSQNEFHMCRRLLQRFEKSVEGVLGQHVNFVDDVDLVARSSRPVLDILANFADLIDAAVARCIDLEHVDIFSRSNRPALSALIAWSDRRSTNAVERLGQD